MALKAVSVSQLNSYIGRILSTDPILCNIGVKGEVSNLTKHSSGHWYFDLKDEDSRVKCFLPSSRVSLQRYDISEGMEITAYGNISLFQRGGYYSLQIKDIEAEGEGNLKIAFDNLKRKLAAEGLFDDKYKKHIPKDPKRIGVITSPTGAAIRDIITTVKRRNPTVDILIYPALVQGENAAASICEGIRLLNERYSDLDVLIIGRGGGSMEDLWAFNEESVARSVFASDIPIISAVGHETDFVISDYVADLRGATPTAAAELSVPHIDNYKDKLHQMDPKRLYTYLMSNLEDAEYRLKMLKIAVDGFDPALVMNKGYAIISKDGCVQAGIANIKAGDEILIKMQDGSFTATVKDI